MVSPRARHRGKHKDLRGQEKSESVTSPDGQSIVPPQGQNPAISKTIQNVKPLEAEPVIDEKKLLSLPIDEARKLGGETRLNRKLLPWFEGAVLEGQLTDMQGQRGKTVGEAPEDIACILVNSAVDNSEKQTYH